MNFNRIKLLSDLPEPNQLLSKIELDHEVISHVSNSRKIIKRILNGEDDRLLAIIGPCSVHDESACLEYAWRLKSAMLQYQDSLFIVMRTYLEKPRTTLGWKGFISDPDLDGSAHYIDGLYRSRKLLYKINQIGVATATEILNPYLHTYYSDLISWAAIGARTTESQPHRELVSGLPYAVGFKNNTDGNIQVILRGGKEPNYHEANITKINEKLKKQGVLQSIMVDLSHGNSQKNHMQQPIVAESICRQIEKGIISIRGVMAESFIKGGNQPIINPLVYGQSITDACLSWEDTITLIDKFHETMLIKHQTKKNEGNLFQF
ncbi:3-deoxy-7-phosphoheptulonate synthase [Xenorhabdus siamensis]|uniref:3-deoxy-7-phosphoheptulonate synthase n=1 Tax=Xenorhabdus siamensis TaxID=3136254 RepID=UPI0030F3D625